MDYASNYAQNIDAPHNAMNNAQNIDTPHNALNNTHNKALNVDAINNIDAPHNASTNTHNKVLNVDAPHNALNNTHNKALNVDAINNIDAPHNTLNNDYAVNNTDAPHNALNNTDAPHNVLNNIDAPHNALNNTSIMEHKLMAISPIDGRYYNKTKSLSLFFSEFAFIKYRIFIELRYLLFLIKKLLGTSECKHISNIMKIHDEFTINDAIRIKEIESEINHDVKAIEYFIKEKCMHDHIKQYVHFGITSQDITTSAIMLSLRNCMYDVIQPAITKLLDKLLYMNCKYANIVMLGRTHGQIASPTFLGKELLVFYKRLSYQCTKLESTKYFTKFGGAVGNLNAHFVAYPNINWHEFADTFTIQLGLIRNKYTTQIDNYDNLSSIFDKLKRINTILLDLVQDMWLYISMDYFKLKIKTQEVGSSTMPHKVNPIDFENAEGNLLIANTLLTFLSSKLPISRLQRDLTDSTILRNLGTVLGHCLIAYTSLRNGLTKVVPNIEIISRDVKNNPIVIMEGIQTILKRDGLINAYELTKDFARNFEYKHNKPMTLLDIHNFIRDLPIKLKKNTKKELLSLAPNNYTGKVYHHCD